MQASQTGTVENKKPALSPEDVLSTITNALDTNKAEEIVPIELKGKTSLADYMVIASGNSQRQVSALCDYVIKALKEKGFTDMLVEGRDHADWILIDCGDVIVHIFRPEVRSFYNLEKMWTTSVADEDAPIN